MNYKEKELRAELSKAMSALARADCKATRAALDLLEFKAREVLACDPSLTEFVMAMGSCGFTDRHGNCVYKWNGNAYPPSIAEFISKYDEDLKLTGVPMRFTATGPKVTD